MVTLRQGIMDKARAEKLSPERRRETAKKAAEAMPAESASNYAPTRTALTVLLISLLLPERDGGAVHPSLHATTNHTRGQG